MGFFKRKRYETEIWSTVLSTLFIFEKGFHKVLLREYPGIKNVLEKGYEEQRAATELGAELAGIILTRNIEELTDRDRCSRIAERLRAWGASRDCLSQFGVDAKAAVMPSDVDTLMWRIQWSIWWLSTLVKDRKLDEYYLNWFISETLGALEGKTDGERSAERIGRLFDDMIFDRKS
jgi:hypothetical protein